MPAQTQKRDYEWELAEDKNSAIVIGVCFVVIVVAIIMVMVQTYSFPMSIDLYVVIMLVVIGSTMICWCARVCESDGKISERESMEQHYLRARDTKRTYVRPKKPIPGVIKSIKPVEPVPPGKKALVKVLRGGEFIGNRMRFKVKVINNSSFIISDVTVYLLSYPNDALQFAGEEHHIFFSKIEPGGFRSPTFDFLPTQDCVRGDIVAGVSYLDERGKPQALTAHPFVIRSVCDLLLPDQVTPQDFELKLKDLECGEITVKIEEWTPREMFDKVLRILDESNFYEVMSELTVSDGIVFGEISGYAKGKYTGKNIAVKISVTGPEETTGASCKIQVSGEDQAMILPAIDDLRERLNAWLCPQCSSSLTLDNVENLRRGEVVQCPFCGISIGR